MSENEKEKEDFLNWPKIVNTVVAFFITAMCCGVVTLLSWIGTTLIANGQKLVEIQVSQQADRKAQDKLIEFYAKDITELRDENVRLMSRIEDLERAIEEPASAGVKTIPKVRTKKAPAPFSKQDYETLLKGDLSRIREMEQQQVPNIMQERQ